jgi:transposase
VEFQQVAQLVEKPIEIFEDQRHHCQCNHCGTVGTEDWPAQIIPGQDLGLRIRSNIEIG